MPASARTQEGSAGPILRERMDRIYLSMRMVPALSGAKNKFELKHSYNTKRIHPVVSELGLVLRQRDDMQYGIALGRFSFSEEFVAYVGKMLPMGVGAHRTAMILVSHRIEAEYWDVIACYTDWTHPVLLWVEKEKPEWIQGRDKTAQSR